MIFLLESKQATLRHLVALTRQSGKKCPSYRLPPLFSQIAAYQQFGFVY
ncbi:hypothetical protein N9Y42_00260 [Mariniblastus sp.]|nr:hypothetical protein [Mariniblastus sp.]